MDSPIIIPEAQQRHSRPTSVRRRVSLDSNSPEFEFWMVRNPSFPQPNLLSADDLFSHGILLPLHTLPNPNPEPDPDDPEPDPKPEPNPKTEPVSEPGPGPKITSSSFSSVGQSKRWRDLFKKSSDKKSEKKKEDPKEKKRERKSSNINNNGGSGSGSGSTELNINIWPFSRSRSAGNPNPNPKPAFGNGYPTRKANSAPCSRSNSAGDSKSRKWPGSPARPGVHLGRASPVWKVRRNSGGKGFEASPLSETRRNNKIPAAGGAAKVVNLNVPMCIGYGNQMGCRSDGNGKNARSSPGAGNLFSLRSLFAKKVY